MNAAGTGLNDVAMLLVELGAMVNAFDADGKQALLYANQAHRPQLAAFLLAHGADPLPPVGTEQYHDQSCNLGKGQTVLLTGKIGVKDPKEKPNSGWLPLIKSQACPADYFSFYSDQGYAANCADGHGIRFSGTDHDPTSDFPAWMYFVRVSGASCD